LANELFSNDQEKLEQHGLTDIIPSQNNEECLDQAVENPDEPRLF
jgi:hypothetical protein